MLSILIPIYNFDIRQLVTDLHQQTLQMDRSVEIICFDDDSKTTYKQQNKEIALLPGVIYRELDKNHGRSAIRNKLATEARYENLLFLDGDVQISSASFIANYVQHIVENTCINGGLTYTKEPPADRKKYLRWYYGVERESLSASIRTQNPYRFFTSCNFMVPKRVFESIRFSEDIQGYGHEDTLFLYQLKQNNIRLKHIDNPVDHLGLDSAEEFLKKTERAVFNLSELVKQNLIGNDVKLVKYYRKLRFWGLDQLVKWIFKLRHAAIMNNLASENPKLRTLDFYKLGLLIEEMHRR